MITLRTQLPLQQRGQLEHCSPAARDMRAQMQAIQLHYEFCNGMNLLQQLHRLLETTQNSPDKLKPAFPDTSASPPLWPCNCEHKRKYVSDGFFPGNWRIYRRKEPRLALRKQGWRSNKCGKSKQQPTRSRPELDSPKKRQTATGQHIAKRLHSAFRKTPVAYVHARLASSFARPYSQIPGSYTL